VSGRLAGLANIARGESLLVVDGVTRRLCLTLGALAELEGAFEADGFAELARRLGQLSANDMVVVLAALLNGGGEPMTPAAIVAARIDPRDAARAVNEAFERAFADD
jgi:hypothetical protein